MVRKGPSPKVISEQKHEEMREQGGMLPGGPAGDQKSAEGPVSENEVKHAQHVSDQPGGPSDFGG